MLLIKSLLQAFLLFSVCNHCVAASIIPVFVTESHSVAGFSGGNDKEFNFASVSVFINPDETSWIAWNPTPNILLTAPEYPDEVFLGMNSFGVDDYISLTITNPNNNSLTVDIDQNHACCFGDSFGPQSAIYGPAPIIPDSLRRNTEGVPFLFNEHGSHNSIFGPTGNYRFDFSFRDKFAPSASHPDIWLLVAPVPEPSAFFQAVVCFAALFSFCRKHCFFR